MRPILLFLSLATAATTLSACSDLAPGADDLGSEIASQRKIWESRRPQAYEYDLERLCFCGEDARGPVRITVSSGTVQRRTYLSNGGSVDESLKPYFPSVDGLFDILEDALDRNAAQIQVTWDTVTGAPLEFWIDYNENVADEEQGYHIVALPRTPS